jgi:hypothetical protein
VDWIVVFHDLVLLVEVKSTWPVQQLRLGTEERVEALGRALGKAYSQIDTTASLIRDRAPEFRHFPHARPIHGLIVTMESFDLANAPVQRDHQPATDTFVSVASAVELEQLVVVTGTPVDKVLLDRAADPQQRTYPLRNTLSKLTCDRNPILDQAWASYPWAER